MTDIARLAGILETAKINAVAIDKLTDSSRFNLDDAYAIQSAGIERAVEKGDRAIGIKMGFTSQAKALQMGITDPIYGVLLSSTLYTEEDLVELSQFCHPRVEPELAFLMSTTVGVGASLEEAYAAVEFVAPALELIDSRFLNYNFTLNDVVADNASSAGFALGKWTNKPEDPSALVVTLSLDGQDVERGSTADVLGNPIFSVIRAAELLAKSGKALEPGMIILTGGATSARALRPGVCAVASVEQVGSVSLQTRA